MKITLTRAIAGHKIGDTIERSTKVAQHIIAAGAAIEDEHTEPTKPTTKATKDDNSNTKPRRSRRSQRRKDDADQAEDPKATAEADKTAGQEGGGVPPPVHRSNRWIAPRILRAPFSRFFSLTCGDAEVGNLTFILQSSS